MSKPGQKVHNQVVFKPYEQRQMQLPFDLESLIPANHKVKIVNRAVDQMNLEALLAKVPGGGSSSFHPVMMTKLIIYAYTDKIYSSRRIEKAARENILYMWLCGGNTPDFKTISNFRSERMKGVIEEVFGEVVDLLLREGHIKFENYFLDGREDHMRNGQLKPGYNVQIGTENQYVLGYSIHQQAGDTSCFHDHMEQLQEQRDGQLPVNIVADAGYGSEENYAYAGQGGQGDYRFYR